MPPFPPRKRLRTPSPQPSLPQKRATSSHKAKTDVFTTFDSHTKPKPSAADTKAFLAALSDDQSSLSEADSDDFEDVLPTPASKKPKVMHEKAQYLESDDDLEFEDVAGTAEEQFVIPEIPEGLQITVREPGESEPARLTLKLGGKTSITKKMRAARLRSHCMHVQFLLWHNVIRNSWTNDKGVHEILLNGLPDALKAEVTKWRLAMGYEKPEKKSKGKKGSKSKNVQISARERIRDWGADAEKSEHSIQGDPLIRLLKYLAAYWKKRFRVTAPSLHKLGYRHPREMREEMDSFNDGPHDLSRHGERIADLEEFRELAKKCQGSRDVCAQLFTALLRGLGIDARLVASLQPTGFGWSKAEEAHTRKEMSAATTDTAATDSEPVKAIPRRQSNQKSVSRGSKKGSNAQPINLDTDDDSLSNSTSSNMEEDEPSAIISTKQLPVKRFDRDLLYPTYWTEVLSPISNTYIPVSTMLHPIVMTSLEHIVNFEPRGAAAERTKQVMCYVVAFSTDGTAKDVTVRYLRKRQWPGKTKGFRILVEKLPVYNRNGKVARYEDYDWFKRVMRGYARPGDKRTLADDIEDEGDLLPVQPEADKKRKAEPDTLQGYKQSTEFVLERHFRREEALLPGSKPVKQFHVGKGDKSTKEPVYKRSDVISTKSVETWHKEGRQVKVGEQALKQVPYRAVTLIRKREIEDQARDIGQKPTQGLYAEYQTEWIIPDPIGPDRVIPKNIFGNIDVYVPSMVPKGAVHIPLKSTVKVCKQLGIDFAEACTGFEFGKQRAVPVLTGVVVAEENEDLVIDAWEDNEKIRQEKESKKKEELVLGLWKKFLRGIRIRERMREEYGATGDDGEEEGQKWAGRGSGLFGTRAADEIEDGGFLRDDGVAMTRDDSKVGGGFLLESENEAEQEGFEIIGGLQDPSKNRRSLAHFDVDPHSQIPMPISMQAMHAEKMDNLDDEEDAIIPIFSGEEGEALSEDIEKEGDVRHEHGCDDAESDDFELKTTSRSKVARGTKIRTKNKVGTPKSKRLRTTRSTGFSRKTSSRYFL